MKSTLQNTWTILTKTERRKFVLLILVDVLISVIDILSLALLLWIIKFYIQPGVDDFSWLPGWLADRNSIAIIALFFIIFSIKNIAAFFVNKVAYKFFASISIRISESNLANYQQSNFEEFVNVDSSVYIRRIAFQPFEFCQYIVAGIQQIITQSVLILLTVIAILIYKATLFLLLLIILLPPVLVVFYFIRKKLLDYRQKIRGGHEKSFQHLLDALKGWVEANIFHRNQFFLNRFIDSRREFSYTLFDSLSLQTFPSRIIEIFAVLGLFALIAIAKWTGNEDSSSLITIGAFMAAAYKIIPGIVRIININGQIKTYEFSMSELIANSANVETENITIPSAAINSVQFHNVNFAYPELPVLNNLNFSIQKGDFLCITGQSGRGKTTVLNLLLGFLQPSAGCIQINDQKINRNELKNYWPSISYMRQQSFFIHDSILRNITLEENNFDKDKLEHAIQMAGVSEMVESFPEGLEKIIAENGKNISGGQQQRIALARAMYKDADLILLDEPLNELDEASQEKILEQLNQLCKNGKMIILISHNRNSIAHCNKITSMDEE